MAILIGFQSVVFAAFTKIFAISEGLLPEDPRLTRMFRYLTLEVGLVVGGLLIVAGTGAWVLGLAYWQSHHFGPLDPEKTHAHRDPRRRVFHARIPDRPFQFFSERSGDVPAMKDAGDLFDQYAAAYEQALSAAIAPSGEGREYFAEGRVAWLKRCLDQIKAIASRGAGFRLRGRRDYSLASPGIERGNAPWEWMSPQSRWKSRETATPRANLRYESMDEFQAWEQMDLAYCNGVFHHIPPAQRAEAFRWCAGRCALEEFFPSGRIVRGAWRRAM